VKKTHLGVNDVAGCTSRGTRFDGRGIGVDDVGVLRLILWVADVVKQPKK
jgi:hypothetical protein